MSSYKKYDINTTTYDWTLKSFTFVKKLLKVNIKLHQLPNQVVDGDIFLFNHFARFETFIPQYLFHQKHQVYCRSVASAEFFEGSEGFAHFLRSVGAVPNTHPKLIPFLAKEILHGRKVVMFPEGGMVKDRKVINKKGKFQLYSRTSHTLRKHHTGAAVLALAVDTFKKAVIYDHTIGDKSRLEIWAKELEFKSIDALVKQCIKPTQIVPCNITFYPIRVGENVLLNTVETLTGGLKKRFIEELTIEGNILFKDTDMDIRLGKPIVINDFWQRWEKWLLPNVAHRYKSLDELFQLETQPGHWRGKLHSLGMRHKISQVRDYYMEQMYQVVTVHLSHLASTLVYLLIEQGSNKIRKQNFHQILYLAVKYCQQAKHVYLHRSLFNPTEYGVVIEGTANKFLQFLSTAKKTQLISANDSYYCFSKKLLDDYNFDEIRIKNFISVYANEVKPIKTVCKLVKQALKDHKTISIRKIADFRFDDQKIAYEFDLKKYTAKQFDAINNLETRTTDGNCFFYKHNKVSDGVLLTHGFLASPVEIRELAEKIHQQGFNVLGVRLKGHGTSPEDLKTRNWQDWYQSVERGFKIINAYSSKVHLIGFSTGGSLSLLYAAKNPNKPASVITVSALLKFQNSHILFTPFLNAANNFIKSLSLGEGIKPYVTNHSEHPDINYKHTPVAALAELNKLVEYFYNHLPSVSCKVDVFQGDNDPVVNPISAELIMKKLPNIDKKLHIIKSNRHGLINENIANIHKNIINLLNNKKSF